MQTVKKIIGVWVCLSISMYGLPAFAVADATASKIELSDAAMAAAVGGSMHAEILSTGSYLDNNTVKAVVAVGNTAGIGWNYTLEAINNNGVRTLASGSLNSPNEAWLISGARQPNDYIYRVKLSWSGDPERTMVQDLVWPQFE